MAERVYRLYIVGKHWRGRVVDMVARSCIGESFCKVYFRYSPLHGYVVDVVYDPRKPDELKDVDEAVIYEHLAKAAEGYLNWTGGVAKIPY